MRPAFLFQTAILLLLGQATLGAIGYLTSPWPWLGLLLPFLLLWLVMRVGRVLREEIARAPERAGVIPWRIALFVAVLWQLPAGVLMLLWPDLTPGVWQGSILPLTGTLGYLWPALPGAVAPWLWTACLPEIALFMTVAAEPVRSRTLPAEVVATAAARMAVGEGEGRWVPARRVQDARKARRDRKKQ